VHFLGACTDFDSPEQIILELLEHPSLPASFLRSVRDRFGDTVARSRVVGNCIGHQRLIAAEQLNSVLEYVDSLAPLPKLPLPKLAPLTIYATMRFRLVAPATREVLPFQNPADYLNQDASYSGHKVNIGSSMASAALSNRSTLSVFFSLPFLDIGSEFFRYVEFLRNNAPFEFSEKHWKIWRLNKARSRYKSSPLELGIAPKS